MVNLDWNEICAGAYPSGSDRRCCSCRIHEALNIKGNSNFALGGARALALRRPRPRRLRPPMSFCCFRRGCSHIATQFIKGAGILEKSERTRLCGCTICFVGSFQQTNSWIGGSQTAKNKKDVARQRSRIFTLTSLNASTLLILLSK